MYREVKKLREREKELNCLYKVTGVLSDESQETDSIFRKVAVIIPEGWQYPGICHARIDFENSKYTSPDFIQTKWKQTSPIIVDGNYKGEIQVFYSHSMDKAHPFLPEEQKLLNNIAEHISLFIFRRRLKNTMQYLHSKKNPSNKVFATGEDEHWQWRKKMAQEIACLTDYLKYGIQDMYLIGSTREATAGPSSDLDLLVHIEGSKNQKESFKEYIDGWSKSLAIINMQKTGYDLRKEGLIDLHIISGEDFKNKNSFASMIDNPANSNFARKLQKQPKP